MAAVQTMRSPLQADAWEPGSHVIGEPGNGEVRPPHRDHIQALIVDEDVPARVGLRTILSNEPDIGVVGEASNGWDACVLVEELRPDVVVMDVQLAGLDGIEATRRILSTTGAATGVLILTTFDVDEYFRQSLDAGASGFLLKRASRAEIVTAVRATASGESTPVPPRPRPGSPLTESQTDVLRFIARGASNREAADGLSMSIETVRTHLKHIYQKSGTRNRLQAALWAYQSGLIPAAWR